MREVKIFDRVITEEKTLVNGNNACHLKYRMKFTFAGAQILMLSGVFAGVLNSAAAFMGFKLLTAILGPNAFARLGLWVREFNDPFNPPLYIPDI